MAETSFLYDFGQDEMNALTPANVYGSLLYIFGLERCRFVFLFSISFPMALVKKSFPSLHSFRTTKK